LDLKDICPFDNETNIFNSAKNQSSAKKGVSDRKTSEETGAKMQAFKFALKQASTNKNVFSDSEPAMNLKKIGRMTSMGIIGSALRGKSADSKLKNKSASFMSTFDDEDRASIETKPFITMDET